MKKPMINEREISQRMFTTMRNKNFLTETYNPNEGGSPESVGMEQGGSPEQEEPKNAIAASESDVVEAQERFRQNVAPDANFSDYTILPDEGNVIFSGSIPGLGQWSFEYTQKEGFGFQTDNQITISNTNFEILKKMFGYFINWREEMSEKLLEYKQNNG